MAKPHMRRSSISPPNHPLLISLSVSQKLQIRASPQTPYTLWLGKGVVTGMHIVSLSDHQVLRTRTITRLVRRDHFNVTELKKFKVAAHEPSVDNQENSHDHMLFQDLFEISCFKENTFEINEKSIDSDQGEANKELPLLQDLRLQEWYQGDLQGYSEKEVKKALKKELSSSHSVVQVT